MRDHRYFVYIVASRPRGVLYTGVTNELVRRVGEHIDGRMIGFTRKYQVKKLVWFEEYGHIHDAIAREKQIKRWRRAWKIELIEKSNPTWEDLFEKVAG
jgi:putative endonuclease